MTRSLSYLECQNILRGKRPFSEMTEDELNEIYFATFKSWPYRLTRQAVIAKLAERRMELLTK